MNIYRYLESNKLLIEDVTSIIGKKDGESGILKKVINKLLTSKGFDEYVTGLFTDGDIENMLKDTAPFKPFMDTFKSIKGTEGYTQSFMVQYFMSRSGISKPDDTQEDTYKSIDKIISDNGLDTFKGFNAAFDSMEKAHEEKAKKEKELLKDKIKETPKIKEEPIETPKTKEEPIETPKTKEEPSGNVTTTPSEEVIDPKKQIDIIDKISNFFKKINDIFSKGVGSFKTNFGIIITIGVLILICGVIYGIYKKHGQSKIDAAWKKMGMLTKWSKFITAGFLNYISFFGLMIVFIGIAWGWKGIDPKDSK